MEIMEAIYSHLMRVGMTSHQSNNGHGFNNLRNSIALLISGLNIFCAVMYLICGQATNLKEYADSIYLIMTVSTAAANFTFASWKMAEIFQFLDNLEKIVNTRLMNSTVLTIYTQASEKIKKITETTNLALVKITPAGIAIPTFIASFVAYLTTDLGPDAFELPSPTMWFPFDVKNPFGYLMAAAFEFMVTFNLSLTVMAVLIIVIAPCLVLISTTNDIKCGLDMLNTSASKKGSHFKKIQQFNQIVQFHSDAKHLANDFSEIMQFVFMIYFTWSTGSICLTMFAIKMELRDNAPNSMVFQSVILLLWSFALVYISCEFGHRLSTAFIEIDHEIGQIHWYKLPQKIWKMLPLAMAAAQKPIYLRVFGSIACAREDFKAVVNLGFSYFMVLQQFEN